MFSWSGKKLPAHGGYDVVGSLEAGTLPGAPSPGTSAKDKNGSIRAGPGNRVEPSI